MKIQKSLNLIATLTLSIIFISLIIPLQASSWGGVSETIQEKTQLKAPPSRLNSQASQPIIIDHTTTNLSQIPTYWIEQAKANLRLSYGHTSHGSQIVSGMDVLMADPLNNHLYDFISNNITGDSVWNSIVG